MSRRTLMLVAGVVAVVAALGVLVVANDDPDPVDPRVIDERATALIQQLGSLCSAYDFQFKQHLDAGTVRPVHCKRPGSQDIRVRLYVFENDDVVAQWRATRLSGLSDRGSVVLGDAWAAIASEADAAKVQKRLGGELQT